MYISYLVQFKVAVFWNALLVIPVGSYW